MATTELIIDKRRHLLSKVIKHRSFSVIIAVMFVLALLVTGTLGWQIMQEAKNEITGKGSVFTAELTKYERAANGSVTTIPIQRTEFYLYKVGSPDTQIGGRYLTDAAGMINVGDLKIGHYYFLETNPSIYYEYDRDSSAQPITRYEFEITGQEVDKKVLVTAHNIRRTGSLTVEKTVINQDGSPLTNAQEDLEFEFSVALANDGAFVRTGTYLCTIYDSTGVLDLQVLDFSASPKIKLKHGQWAVIAGLPAGYTYTVTETGTPGYYYTSNGHTGTIVPWDSAANPAIASYTNIYGVPPTDDTIIRITKHVVGEISDSEKGREFNFYIIIGGQVYYFKLKDGESIEYLVPGGSEYEVLEDDYTLLGYLQSILNGKGIAAGGIVEVEQYNTFDATVEVDIDGEKTWDITADPTVVLPGSIIVHLYNGSSLIESAIVTPDVNGEWHYHFHAPKYEPNGYIPIKYTVVEEPIPSFVDSVNGYDIKNTYFPPIIVDPPVVKLIIGDTPPSAVKFSFRLEGLNGAPMPSGSQGGQKTITTVGAGPVEFGDITYTQEGVYHYTVTEISTGEPGYTYDKAIYDMIVTVTAQNAGLVADRVITRRDDVTGMPGMQPLPAAEFVNKYNDFYKEIDMIELSGTKTWEHGRNPKDKWPTSVIIYIKNGADVVTELLVDASANWSYKIKLPEFDKNGEPITYTVGEASVPNYMPLVDGYDIRNVYIEGNGGGIPKTGDKIKLFLISLTFLLALAIIEMMFVYSRLSARSKKRLQNAGYNTP